MSPESVMTRRLHCRALQGLLRVIAKRCQGRVTVIGDDNSPLVEAVTRIGHEAVALDVDSRNHVRAFIRHDLEAMLIPFAAPPSSPSTLSSGS
jgi:hypothetical protein